VHFPPEAVVKLLLKLYSSLILTVSVGLAIAALTAFSLTATVAVRVLVFFVGKVILQVTFTVPTFLAVTTPVFALTVAIVLSADAHL